MVLAVGTVAVGVAATLTGYLYGIWDEERETRETAATWVVDHAGLVGLGASLELPEDYRQVDCDSGDDSRCWQTTDRPSDAAAVIQLALTSAGLSDATVDCQELGFFPGMADGACAVSAPFGHDRSAVVDVMRDLDLDTLREGLDAGEGDAAYAEALTGTSRVTLSIPPLCDDSGC